MKGLELSRRYWAEVVSPALTERFGDRFTLRAAAGLVGDGSECYGFDDETSQDHDFGPRVQIWLNDSDYAEFGAELQSAYIELPRNFLGYNGVNLSQFGDGREGVFPVSRFYARYIGRTELPQTLNEWRVIPEVNLSIVTNGEVFTDPAGEFTAFRSGLLEFYPEDLRLKKIAAHCMKAAQAGQYNYPRSVKRGEYTAAFLAAGEFAQVAASLVFLLNRRYTPFYKWIPRALRELPALGKFTADELGAIAESGSDYFSGAEHIERLSAAIIEYMQSGGLTESKSDFLLDHAPYVQAKIKDEQLKRLPLWNE
ncbi:MAG: DUF4037 domain-containing protein [Oscillospiraceae bacterium]|jgi:hypothetical protein|nr:DUF4037 domain-containing protein [Oscillospiraceae bacterium]